MLASRRHQEALLRALPVGVFYTDATGSVVYSNEMTSEILGLSFEEMLGFNWVQYLHPEDRDKVHTEIMRCNDNQEFFAMEYRFVRPDGKTVWVSDRTAPYSGPAGKLMGFVGTMVDITANKESEEVLRFSEERFSKAFLSSPCPMSINSLKDGQFITINKSFTQLFGYLSDEVIGRTSLELNLWENPELRSKFIKDALEMGSVYNLEVVFRAKSGLKLEGIHSAEVIELNGEQCLLSVFNNLTERKQMEKEMARLDRLFIVGEMAAGIAHEIRNPMTTVRGNLQLLGARKENSHLKEYFNIMVSEIDRGNSIITEYLTLARDKATKKSNKDLNSILQTILPLLVADATKDDKT
ncbi:MAG: PAS domain S-box protein [Bacillota bacterium]